jgi:hypothetical protein
VTVGVTALALGSWVDLRAAPVVDAQVARTITIEAPAGGASIASPVAVRGRVSVAPFENNLVGRVFDGQGRVVGEGPVTVTSPGPGQPGMFAGTLAFAIAAVGPGRVEIADVDVADGSVLASASVSVNLVLPGAEWLDQAQPANWNARGAPLPAAPPPPPGWTPDPRCEATARPPETPEDAQVAGAGWTLFGDYRSGWGMRVVTGQANHDGMCRPLDYQVFVFASGVFAGTMSPAPMDSRSDGAWFEALIGAGGESLFASFQRYKAEDALCCPSGETEVGYRLDRAGPAPLLVPVSATTHPTGSAP